MKPIERDDILDLATYESVREEYRARVIAHKQARRVSVGDRVTLVFEDRETVRYQIQEMARIEHIEEPAKIEHEIAVYNGLLPAPGGLSATLFIEIPELDRVRPELDRLVGIDECVSLEIGSGADASRAPAAFDDEQMEEDRISAVHYVRFALTPAQVEAFEGGAAARLCIEHPNYAAHCELGEATRASLLRDLRGDPPVLIDVASVSRVSGPSDEIVLEDGRVRVLAPAHPRRQHHFVVEPLVPVAALAALDPQVAAALFETARQLAGELAAKGIAARIVCDEDPRSDATVCLQVVSTES